MNRGQIPPKAPPPPPARIVREGFIPPAPHDPSADAPPSVKLVVIAGIAFAAVVLYALPDLAAWIQGRAPAAGRAAVHARAQAGCRMPAVFEQLHIVVSQRDGQIAAECMYVGSRGTYSRRP